MMNLRNPGQFAIFLLFLLCFLGLTEAEAQRRKPRPGGRKGGYIKRVFHIGEISYSAGAGIASYFGDLKDGANLQAKPSLQLGINYRFHKNLSLRSELLWYRISGADSLNDPLESGIYDRNLSFRADNIEANVNVVGYLFNKYSRYNRPTLNPYAFLGIGLSTNNPKAEYQGEMVSLRPLQTEGKSYSGIVFVVPAGIGITYHANRQLDISAELGYRLTFSDYLDDVSTVHLDLSTIDDPLRKALADRRPEKELSPAPAGGQRGNPSSDDLYLVTGLKLTFTPGPAQRSRYRKAKW